ncbi:hypothetical protein QR77_38040 [Streptomyces sp. 150FB]|uniref:MFS transporter n=1 Tax=Streptomyces sp. 150FB TaxID=1576605 RepID=UPI0005890F3A|nr:MFS transporter [Streptomyces sp. 150FB]KIF78050.1 hypothetical protein QR77_38040 [Streptomyces sp. 150FB]
MRLLRRRPDSGSAAVRILILNALVGNFGTGLFLAGYVIYFTRVVGLTAWEVTGGMSAAGVAGLVASVPIAALADRYGHRRSLIALHLLRAGAYIAYAWVGNFPEFVAVACLITLCDKASQSLSQALTGTLTGEKERTRALAKVRVTQNIGMSLGSFTAAAVLEIDLTAGFRVLTVLNGLSFVFTATQLWRLRRLTGPAPEPVRHTAPPESSFHVGKWRQLGLSGVNGVLSMHSTLLFTAIPLWISAQKDVSPSLVSLVIAINTILTAAGQVWWTRFSRTPRAAATAAMAAGLALAACSVAMSLTGALGPLGFASLTCAAAVLLTVAENLHVAAAWEISFALSPENARGAYLAVFGLGQSARDIGGPPLAAAALTGLGAPGWVLLGAVFTLGGGGFRHLALRLLNLTAGPEQARSPGPTVTPRSTE